jgi:hypothetical protein
MYLKREKRFHAKAGHKYRDPAAMLPIIVLGFYTLISWPL